MRCTVAPNGRRRATAGRRSRTDGSPKAAFCHTGERLRRGDAPVRLRPRFSQHQIPLADWPRHLPTGSEPRAIEPEAAGIADSPIDRHAAHVQSVRGPQCVATRWTINVLGSASFAAPTNPALSAVPGRHIWLVHTLSVKSVLSKRHALPPRARMTQRAIGSHSRATLCPRGRRRVCSSARLLHAACMSRTRCTTGEGVCLATVPGFSRNSGRIQDDARSSQGGVFYPDSRI